MMRRQCIEAKTGWKFCLDPENIGIRQNWHKNGLENAREVFLPHTFSVEGESEEYRGNFWYEYDFEVLDEWKDKQIWFDFHGIYRDADFWVNGEEADRHCGGGFTSFKLDVTDLVKLGSNRLVIRGTNAYSPHALPWDRQFDWSDDGGIFRLVYLNVCARDGIRQIRIHQNVQLTEGIRAKEAPVQVEAEVFRWRTASGPANRQCCNKDDSSNGCSALERYEWSYELYEGAPECRGKKVYAGTAAAGEKIRFRLECAKLWHFDHPHLYTFCLHLIKDGQEEDYAQTAIGFRSLTVKNAQFLLNGEIVQLVGTEWMPGSDPRIGNAETKEDIAAWLTRLKGCNCIFTRVHWQQDDFFFDWCDRKGMLVQEEVPLWGQPKEPVTHEEVLAKAQIDEMLEAHFNHPSIISWGVGNELDGQSSITAQYVKNMKNYINEKDPGRLMSYVSNTLWETPDDAAALGDMIMANDYMGTWHGDKDERVEIPRFWNEHREKPMVISEFGLCEPAFAGGDPRREAIFLKKMSIYRELGINGIIYFCLNDYRTQMGEEGEGRFRRRVHGSMDLYGNPKPSYEAVKRECAPLYIQSVTPADTPANIPVNEEAIQSKQVGLEIVLANKTALPRYEADGYILAGFDRAGCLVSQTVLADFKPGQKQTVFLADPQKRLARLVIARPDGSESVSHSLDEIL